MVLARFGADAVHQGADQGPWGEILTCAGFCVLGVALQQPFVDIAFHVRLQRHPLRAVHHGDQAEELGWIGDLVLRLGENLPEHPSLLPQFAQQQDVMRFQFRAAAVGEAGPVAACRDTHVAVVGGPGILVRHLEEDEVG